MREFRFTNPVLIDDENGIIAGMTACSRRASSAWRRCRASS
jgi:hypothetical protein